MAATAGIMTEGRRVGRRSGVKPLGEQRAPLNVCDVSSNGFKRAWLMLKEHHDKQVSHLQERLTAMLKKLRSDGRQSGSLGKIKELIKQKKALNDTIHALQNQLRSKRCDRCSINESLNKNLQQEFYDIQQRNLMYMSKIIVERNQLREENKRLLENLNSKQQELCSFIWHNNIFPQSLAREQSQGSYGLFPRKRLKTSYSERKKSEGEKAFQPNPPTSCLSKANSEVSETSSVKTSFSFGDIIIAGRDNKNSSKFPATATLGSQMGHGLQGASLPLEDMSGQPKMSTSNVQKISSQIYKSQSDLSWLFPTGENEPTQGAVETTDENMSDANLGLYSFSQTRQRLGLRVFPLDYTSRCKRKRSMGVACARQNTSQRFSNQSILVKTTTESTKKEYMTDTQIVKRKAKMK